MAEDDLLVPAQPGPDLNIPDGTSTVEVACMDTTSRFRLTMTTFLQPDYVGNPDLKGPSFSFLIKHNDDKILFDLGIRSDFQKLPVYEKIVEKKWDVHVDKDAATILKEHDLDIDGGAIRSIILSHHHWDHTGNISLFPHSTEVVVGPGFVKAHLPGRPDRPDSTLLQSDFEGRAVREINFAAASSKQIKIGRFRAHDFFGDGSFYLLDTPGHSVGHICGLARTSVSPATFVFMGGDACHHGAEFKPNVHTPLPKNFHPSPLKKYRGTCPGEALQHIHPYSKANEPFYYVTESFPDDKKVADWTVEGLEEFDADPHVLMVVAHDNSLVDPVQLPVFPQTLNTWHEQGLAKKVRWIFLRDLDEAVVAKEEGKEPFKWADQ